MKRGQILLAAFLLAGCARFHPQPLAPAESAERIAGRSLTNLALRAFLESSGRREIPNWPAESWDFEMLTLAAFYYHPSLEVARAQWAVARGGEVTAGQRPNPSLDITPGYDTTTSIPSPWIPLTFLDIPIETAGKRGYRKAQAARLSEAARLNIATVAWQIRSELRSGLIEFLSAEQREALLQRQVSVQEQVVKLLEGQLAAGAVAASELFPYRITLVKTRLDLLQAQRTGAEARARVAEAIGIPLRALEGVKLTFRGLENLEIIAQLSSAEVRRAALQSRPDILGALAEYAAAQSALQLEIAKQYPDLRLQPGYQYDQGDSKWTLGVVVDLPILNQNQGPIAEAKARRQESAARFVALQTKVLAEIERAAQAVGIAEKATISLRALGEEQSKRSNALSAQLRAGAADQLEILNAQFESLTTEQAQLEGRLQLQQAVGALEDAVRRPFELPAAVFESTQTKSQ